MTSVRTMFEKTGRMVRSDGSIFADVPASIGELVWIRESDGTMVSTEVIGFDDQCVQLMPLATGFRFRRGDLAIASGQSMRVCVGQQLLGRIVNALGQPIDGGGPHCCHELADLRSESPAPLTRAPIEHHFETGIRAIDSLLTIGRGQRVGIFSGSGVGKSTLLGDIARHAESDVNVVALVGERGREVRPFVEQSLGRQGLEKSVVIVSTSDESPLTRIRAVETAVAIAGWFRDQQKNVLFMLDSITRFAAAQRELGLLLGEPPTSRGYPPSVFQRLASILEQLGNSHLGSVTALLTVLVDGDDMNDPVADAARSILDGHIVLDRRIAERNHFPAIDILASISRLAPGLVSEEHLQQASLVKKTVSLYRDVEDLVQIGAYQKGEIPDTDRAIECQSVINRFLQQDRQPSDFAQTLTELSRLALVCGYRQKADS